VIRKATPLLVILAALALIVPVQMKVDAVRLEHKLTPAGEERAGRSAVEVIATVGLGGFRGLAVDYLWFRTMQMQAERRYYEIALLCQLILKMEPYFPQIWAFHAWNMAYNISVETPDKEGRWRWIEQSLDILEGENQGLALNGDSYVLYWELGWIYYHRCTPKGRDDHGRYFASQVARRHASRRREGEGALSVVFRLAEENFRAAAEKDDISPLMRRRAQGMAVHAMEARGDWAGAEREWLRLIDESPLDEDTARNGLNNFYMGIIFRYHAQGNAEESRRWFGRLQKHFPEHTLSYEETLKQAGRELGDIMGRE